MSADDEKTIRFTELEFKKVMDSITQAAQDGAVRAVNEGLADALESYAAEVEKAPIHTTSEEMRQGAEAALRAIADGMRRAAQTYRDKVR